MSSEGRLITGRYRLHQRIGSGAMGVVWRAVDERLQRTVAVKQLLLQPGYTDAETQEARERSMREGRIAARLQHQNAIAVFDVAEDEGQPVLVMEYLPSQSLASMISDHGVLPPLEVARIGAQVASALAAAHMAGIVHRDLKPGNILLGDNGQSKITDFGISRAIGDVAITKSGILAGTPAYLSPEVALGRDPAPASDVFSLGSTLYAAIEGHPPFGVDENAISLLHRVSRGQVDPPRQAGPMTAALMQLLRADPVDRPTMAQAQTLLQAVVDGRPIPAHSTPSSGWQQAPAAAPTSRQSQGSGGTRVGAPASHPSTQVAEAAPASGTGRARSRTVAVWVAALVAAVLIGVLAASAFSGGGERGQSNAQPPPAPPPAPVPVTTSTTAAPTTSSSPPTTSSAPPSTSSAPSSTPESSAEKKVSPKKLESTVKKYFSLVPDKLDKSWSLLGPQLRSVGRDQYEEFWGSIEDVRVVGKPRAIGDKKVVVNLLYKKEEGGRSLERKIIGMVVEDGKPLLNTDKAA